MENISIKEQSMWTIIQISYENNFGIFEKIMKIAIFSDTFMPQVNGVANVVGQLAAALSDRGHQVQVITIVKNRRNVQRHFEGLGYDVVCLPSLPILVYPGYRFTLPLGLLRRRFKKDKPDIIHAHTQFTVGREAVRCAKALDIPIVGTSHTFFDHYLKHAKINYKWGEKLAWKYTTRYYNLCEAVLIPSRSLAEAMTKNGLHRYVEIVPNPINPIFFQTVPNSAEKKKLKSEMGIRGKSLVYMGRVSYEKSIDKVLEAFNLVLEECPDTQLMIIGDGPEKKKLEKMAQNMGIAKKIVFTGYLQGDDLVRAMQSNEIFITASVSENMPLSVLEAMACGLPIIAVSALGIPEIVKDGQNGCLAQSNEPSELAQKILNILSEDSKLAEFSRVSLEFAKQYTHNQVCDQHEEIYKKIIESHL